MAKTNIAAEANGGQVDEAMHLGTQERLDAQLPVAEKEAECAPSGRARQGQRLDRFDEEDGAGDAVAGAQEVGDERLGLEGFDVGSEGDGRGHGIVGAGRGVSKDTCASMVEFCAYRISL